MRPIPFRPDPIRLETGCLPFSDHKPRELGRVPDKLLQFFRELVMGRSPWPLFLHGDEGRGKSCAALALLDHVPGGFYITCFQLVRLQMDSFKDRSKGINWERIDPKKCPLLVLDEMGLGKVSDTHYEVVHEVLDRREGAGLICISNHSLDTLASIYDRRTTDRLGAGVQFELKGTSRRTG